MSQNGCRNVHRPEVSAFCERRTQDHDSIRAATEGIPLLVYNKKVILAREVAHAVDRRNAQCCC